MDFEKLKQGMLRSAARHDAEIAIIREGLAAANRTLDRVAGVLDTAAEDQVRLRAFVDRSARMRLPESGWPE